jgi:hypothetical protein
MTEETPMTSSTTQPPRDPLTAIWFALGLLVALLVGVAAGVLGRLGGELLPVAVLTGFGAFGGTVTLAVLVINLFKR